ncbi:plant UBX domain-containing protein 4-like [Argentina anserina]|uniref:plant UBX domain-containing protein 4-like n=1 Tax=Argentina anserina TaxID=57926 RepID=UPI0021766DB8|nr:plant UBX domain-containing protein 4-like [Potentilla anserina]
MEAEGQEANPQNDAVVTSFCEITSASNQEARFFLESHNWDLDAAVSTFFENETSAVAEAGVPVTANPVAAPSHSLSPSPSHSPEYSPSQSPARSRSPSPAPSRQAYQLRSKHSASGTSKEDNKPRTRGGIRTLSDLNGRPEKDGSDSDSDEPNEYYTGGEKSGMLVQDPRRGGENDVDSIFAQARQFAQAPPESSSSSRSFTGTARTLTGETVPTAAPQPPESVNHTITFWNNGFTVDDGPLRRVDDPANADFMASIRNSDCPKELEPASRRTAVHVSLMKREEDYPEPVKQCGQVAFQGVGRTLGGSTSESAASDSTAAAAAAPLTTAPLPSLGLTVDQSLPSTSIQLRLADGTRMVSRFNNYHTIRDIHAFIDASRPGGIRNYRLQTMGFPPKQLTDLDQTIEQAGAANSVIIQKL